jgi:cell wall-associated NlpC family hydrolase
MLNGNNWVTMKTVTLPSGAAKTSASIVFPNNWWGKTTKWILVIPQSSTAEKYTSRTLTIKSIRKYQNPGKYVQISDTINKHGYSYYVSPVLVNSTSTRSDHVEALIKTANKYKGDSYVNTKSGAPGGGIDASGLVIQACYGAGVDLWPISPSTRPYNCVPSIMDSKLASITYTANHVNMTRGDLIFFQISDGNYGHVAIYTGLGKIIHASPVTGKVENSTIEELIKPVEDGGKYGYPESTIKVRRIFN